MDYTFQGLDQQPLGKGNLWVKVGPRQPLGPRARLHYSDIFLHLPATEPLSNV